MEGNPDPITYSGTLKDPLMPERPPKLSKIPTAKSNEDKKLGWKINPEFLKIIQGTVNMDAGNDVTLDEVQSTIFALYHLQYVRLDT